ncbi:MGH1-like glycoside hydrolase domain-containing protein [Streptomyces seoulensis]
MCRVVHGREAGGLLPALAAAEAVGVVEAQGRGPVWLDQFLFAVSGLRSYGYQWDAAALTEAALRHAEGLLGDAPIRENYNPLTGAGQNTTNFTWSATALLELLRGGIARED